MTSGSGAAIGVALVDGSESHLREVLATIERFVVARPDVELLGVEMAWLEADETLDARLAEL